MQVVQVAGGRRRRRASTSRPAAIFPHPRNPAGEFPVDDRAKVYGSMLLERRAHVRATTCSSTARPARRLFSGCGTATAGRPTVEGINLPRRAARSRQAVSIPVHLHRRLPDRVADPQGASRTGDCDGVAMARPLVANNDLPKLFAAGTTGRPKPCTYCNQCLRQRAREPARAATTSGASPHREEMIEQIFSVYTPSDTRQSRRQDERRRKEHMNRIGSPGRRRRGSHRRRRLAARTRRAAASSRASPPTATARMADLPPHRAAHRPAARLGPAAGACRPRRAGRRPQRPAPAATSTTRSSAVGRRAAAAAVRARVPHRSARPTAPTTTSSIPRWAAPAPASGATSRSSARAGAQAGHHGARTRAGRQPQAADARRVRAGDDGQRARRGLAAVHDPRLVRARQGGRWTSRWEVPLADDDPWPERPMEIPRTSSDPTRPAGADERPRRSSTRRPTGGTARRSTATTLAQQKRCAPAIDGKLHIGSDGRLPAPRRPGARPDARSPGFWLGLQHARRRSSCSSTTRSATGCKASIRVVRRGAVPARAPDQRGGAGEDPHDGVDAGRDLPSDDDDRACARTGSGSPGSASTSSSAGSARTR